MKDAEDSANAKEKDRPDNQKKDSPRTSDKAAADQSMNLGEPSASFPLVSVVMGSQSDWPDTMKAAADTLKSLSVPYEAKIVSAHRTPERLYQYAKR